LFNGLILAQLPVSITAGCRHDGDLRADTSVLGRAMPAQIARLSHNSYYLHMKEISAREAKNQFGQFLDWAQRAPVRVTKRGRPVGVMMSEEQFHRLRGAAWERFRLDHGRHARRGRGKRANGRIPFRSAPG
jgi:prevent-host-death family protein